MPLVLESTVAEPVCTRREALVEESMGIVRPIRTTGAVNPTAWSVLVLLWFGSACSVGNVTDHQSSGGAANIDDLPTGSSGGAPGSAGTDSGATSGGSGAGGSSATTGGAGGTGGADGFSHPGVLVNRAQLDFIRQQIRAGAEPWNSALGRATRSSSGSLSFSPQPRAIVECGSYSNPNNGCSDERASAVAAYTHALLWYFTEDVRHAEKAVQIMNAWSAVL